MKPFTVQCEYSAHHRFETTVEAEDPIAACRAAIELANDSSDWRSHCGPTPSYVVALAPGVHVDPWRDTPEGADASVLPVPGLFTDTARVAGMPRPGARTWFSSSASSSTRSVMTGG